MFKDLLARFKRIFTVADWKREAQDAMKHKEFVVASLDELRRIEREEMAMQQDRAMSRSQTNARSAQSFGVGNNFSPNEPYGNARMSAPKRREEEEGDKRRQDVSLADLMNAIRQQQESL